MFRKSFIFFLLFMVLFICAYGFYDGYQDIKQKSIYQLNKEQLIYAKLTAKAFEGYFANLTVDLRIFSESNNIITLNDNGINTLKKYYEYNSSDIQAITRINKDGIITYTYPEDNRTGVDISSVEHIKTIIETKKPTISDVHLTPRGFQTIVYNYPIFKNGVFDGCIGVLINFDAIAKKYLENIKKDQTGYAWMISQKGVELYCPVPGHVGNSVLDNCIKFPSIISMAKEMMEGKSGYTTYYFNKEGTKESENIITKHAVYYPIHIGNTFWSLVITSSEDEILGDIKTFKNFWASIVIFLFISGFGLMFIFVKTVYILKEEYKRIKIERDLAESEKKYKLVFNNAPIGLLHYNKDGVVTECNKVFENIVGAQHNKIIGFNMLTQLRDNEMKNAVIKSFNGEIGYYRGNYTSVTGEKTTEINVINNPIMSLDNEFLGAVAIFEDITDRKQVEKELLLNITRLKSIINIFQYDFKSIKELLDYALEEAIKLTESKIGYIYFYNEDRKEFELNCWSNNVMEACLIQEKKTIYALDKTGIWGEAVRQKKPIIINDFKEKNILKKGYPEGHVELCSFMTIPLIIKEQIVAVIGVANKETDYNENDIMQLTLLTDTVWKIVEKLKTEEDNTKLQTQLLQSQKMETIGTLAGGIAHDFNNILWIIMGFTELLLNKPNIDKIDFENLSQIIKASNRAKDLVKQILIFSRKSEKEIKVINIDEVIKETIKMLQSTIQKNIEIIFDLKAIDTTILADYTQMHQTIMNICNNAVYAMKDTGGLLKLTTQNIIIDKDSSLILNLKIGEYIQISITDQGGGIPNNIISKIFDPFFTTKEKGKGTGLGLSVVHGIVKNHDGIILVNSVLGEGSIFEIYLPVVDIEIAHNILPNNKEKIRGKEIILIIDDEEQLISMNETILNDFGYTIKTSTNSIDGLEIFKLDPYKYDLVMTDYAMPKMNGIELAKNIINIRKNIPIILCTGYNNQDIIEDARKIGITNIINKPITVQALLKIIRDTLDTYNIKEK